VTGVVETIAALVADIDAVLASGQGAGAITDARQRQLMENLVASIAPSEATLTYSSSLSWNVSTNPVAKVTLTGNVTITVSGGEAGVSYRLAVIQDGTGSRTVTLSGVTVLGTAVWATAAGAVNILTIDDVGGTRYATVI
jgi:hypothetical protein